MSFCLGHREGEEGRMGATTVDRGRAEMEEVGWRRNEQGTGTTGRSRVALGERKTASNRYHM